MEQLEELRWEDFFGIRAVKAAYQQLKSLTRRALSLHPRRLVPRIPNPFWCPSRTTIRVFIDQASPTVSHAIVHELIHAILMEEGYHRLTGEQLRCYEFVRNVLSNEFQHPEVFRRMESYGLDMAPYWAQWECQLRKMLEDMRRDVTDPYASFRHHPQVFTWFFFQHVTGPYLNGYKALDSTLYQAASVAYEATRIVGFSTRETHRQFLAIYKANWLHFCEVALPRDIAGQSILQAIKNSMTRPVSEIAEERSDEEVLDALGIRRRN